jgi:hypothetical protein
MEDVQAHASRSRSSTNARIVARGRIPPSAVSNVTLRLRTARDEDSIAELVCCDPPGAWIFAEVHTGPWRGLWRPPGTIDTTTSFQT